MTLRDFAFDDDGLDAVVAARPVLTVTRTVPTDVIAYARTLCPTSLPEATRVWLERAEEFDAANPAVWELFEELALERINRGFRRYTAAGIIAQIRWHEDVPTDDGLSSFRLNENYSKWFGLKFMLLHPEHEGFFEVRW